MPPIFRRPQPLVLSEAEIQAVLLALGDGGIPANRPDLASALVRAKRVLRREIQPPPDDSGSKQR